jgi:hypothetical protein
MKRKRIHLRINITRRQKFTICKMWITNGTKEGTYRINKGELIPEGYWKGRVCFDIKPKGETATAYGRMWINNGNKNKMIPKQSQIPEGYKKGRLV